MPKKIVASILFCALLTVAGGCARSASLKTWQAGVDQYVKDKGNNPEVLRTVTLDGTRAGFAVIGDIDPRKTTDARAILLAHKAIEAKPCFIYLVGIVKNQSVQDIRLAVVTFTTSPPTWHIGEKNADALKTYREGGVAMWHERSGERKVPPTYTTFPRESDLFDVIITGPHVEARHAQTGAVFSAHVSPASAPSR